MKTPLVAGSTAGLDVVWRTLEPAARAVGQEGRLRHLMFPELGPGQRALPRHPGRGRGGRRPRGRACSSRTTSATSTSRSSRGATTRPSSPWPRSRAGPESGKIAKELGTIFVDRDKRKDAARAAEQIRERLARGETVVLFPEGRAGDGDGAPPPLSCLLEPAAKLGLPVRWAALGYVTPPGEPSASEVVCRTESISFGAHLHRLMRLPRIHARIAYGDAPIQDGDRKRLAKQLEEAVRSRFRPVAAGSPPAMAGG